MSDIKQRIIKEEVEAFQLEQARSILRAHASARLREFGENAPQDRCPFCGFVWVKMGVTDFPNIGDTRYSICTARETDEWVVGVKFCPDCGMPLEPEKQP